ncbi:MAG TPA: ATP-dependent DNA helicase RecG [Acidimicrobiales bacterium]|nr:ATP-dependent DNA helicase RecG [Acidimicrobiales bacterium]
MTDDSSPLTLEDLSELPVTRLKGVGPKKEKSLISIDIGSVLDILTHYPRRYIDRTKEAKIGSLEVGEEGMVLVEILDVQKRRTRNKRQMVSATVSDGTGNLSLTFFNQPWRERQLTLGREVIIFGKLERFRGQNSMVNPVVDLIGDKTGRFVPVYPQSGKAGLTTWEFANWVNDALEKSKVRGFAEPLPQPIRKKYGLISRDVAFRKIHNPDEMSDMQKARKRLVFDELFRIQLLLIARKLRLESSVEGIGHDFTGDYVAKLFSSLPFEPTNAQKRVIDEILSDLRSSSPMHRLLQGDVGSGKTLVAVAGLLSVVEGNKQGAIMAPTEVLAEQHYLGIAKMLEGFMVQDTDTLLGERSLKIALLTSQTAGKESQAIREGLSKGSIDIVVGTHSLIQDSVVFSDLGLTVVDEQHRFGVDQRAALRAQGKETKIPDVLVMTATPIPRTAAMTIYGDLDVSVLDELPLGRSPIHTERVSDTPAIWEALRHQISLGYQAFIVCPLIEENEKMQTTSAEETFLRLQKEELHDLRLGLLHGRLPPIEKQQVMERFRRGDLDILVSTTVIEVGVDVPNATVMVILSAERFGIAQLHQLRGRVGRGQAESKCYLVSDSEAEEATERLQALVDTTDGFELAERDLEIRGEGTIMGVSQKGKNDFKIASLRRDKEWVQHARDAAFSLLTPEINVSDISLLADEVKLFFKDEEVEYLFKS